MNRRAAMQPNDRLPARLNMARISPIMLITQCGCSACRMVFLPRTRFRIVAGNADNRAVRLYAPLTTNGRRRDLSLVIAGGLGAVGAEGVQVGGKISRGIAQRNPALAILRATIGLAL